MPQGVLLPLCDVHVPRPQWIQTMEVDTLPGGGRRQPFYRVLVSDRAAEEQAAGVGPALGGGRRQSAAAAAAGLGGTARVHPAQRGVHNSAEAEVGVTLTTVGIRLKYGCDTVHSGSWSPDWGSLYERMSPHLDSHCPGRVRTPWDTHSPLAPHARRSSLCRHPHAFLPCFAV